MERAYHLVGRYVKLGMCIWQQACHLLSIYIFAVTRKSSINLHMQTDSHQNGIFLQTLPYILSVLSYILEMNIVFLCLEHDKVKE